MDGKPWTRGYYFILAVFYMTFKLSSADNFRILGSVSKCAGTVEFYNGTSTRVCSNNWGLTDAKVVCQLLKCGEALAAGASPFGSGTGSNWLTDVACGGSETSLIKCKHSRSGSCSGDDAGVVCSGGFPKPNVSQNHASVTWGDRTAVTCSVQKALHQLARGRFTLTRSNSDVQKSSENNDIATFDFSNVTFEDEGQYDCCYHIQKSFCTSVDISVTVHLQTPNISVSSPDEPNQRALDIIQVTRGYSFIIHCSTLAHYPEGLFFLLSNVNTTQKSVNHSASFHFPEAQHEHQGNYSCVYQVTGAGRTYTSPQTPVIMVTVKSPLLPVILPVVAVVVLLPVLIGLYICCRRRRVVQLTTSNQTPMSVRNQYEDSDEEEEVDYVNITAATGNKPMDSSESEEEPDYVNVSEPLDVHNLYNYGGSDSIYQNY